MLWTVCVMLFSLPGLLQTFTPIICFFLLWEHLRSEHIGVGEIAQLLKCLLQKHAFLSLIPEPVLENTRQVKWTCSLSTGRWRQEHPWGLLASYSALLVSSRPMRDPVTKKGEWCHIWSCLLASTCDMHLHTCTHAYMHTSACTCIHTQRNEYILVKTLCFFNYKSVGGLFYFA